MAWAYVPISTLRFVEVKLLEEALVTRQSLAQRKVSGLSRSRDPPTSRKLRIRQETGLFVGKENQNGSSNSRIRFPIAAGESQKSHEA
jgi:hypothetical protein